MAEVDDLLLALVAAARRNEKAEFDRTERELLSHFGGRLDAMPEEVYQRYLDVDRHWPIAVEPSAERPGARRTLQIRLGGEEEAWLQGIAVQTDRSLSAVIAECVDAVRGDASLTDELRARLERGRRLGDD